jgi:hypothetical protein
VARGGPTVEFAAVSVNVSKVAQRLTAEQQRNAGADRDHADDRPEEEREGDAVLDPLIDLLTTCRRRSI